MPSSCRHYISETLAPISLLERSLSPRASEHTQPPTPHSSHPTGYRRIDVAGGVATIVGRDEVRARRRRTSISDVGRHVAPPPPVPRCPLRAATRFFSPTWFLLPRCLLSVSLSRAPRRARHTRADRARVGAQRGRRALGGRRRGDAHRLLAEGRPEGLARDLVTRQERDRGAVRSPYRVDRVGRLVDRPHIGRTPRFESDGCSS